MGPGGEGPSRSTPVSPAMCGPHAEHLSVWPCLYVVSRRVPVGLTVSVCCEPQSVCRSDRVCMLWAAECLSVWPCLSVLPQSACRSDRVCLFCLRVPVGLPDTSSYPVLVARLLARSGWSQQDVRRLVGLNFIRVFRRVERVRHGAALPHRHSSSREGSMQSCIFTDSYLCSARRRCIMGKASAIVGYHIDRCIWLILYWFHDRSKSRNFNTNSLIDQR